MVNKKAQGTRHDARGSGSGFRKKKTILSMVWISIAVFLAIIIIVLFMLIYTPGRYQPSSVDADGSLSPYFTNHIVPDFYNRSQLDEPFELIITSEQLNELIAYGEWPQQLSGVSFSAPAVALSKNTILLMGTVSFADLPVVVTIVLKPRLSGDGMLELNFCQIKAGALDITLLGKGLAGSIIKKQLEENDEDWLKVLSAVILKNEPADPVFDANSRKVRLIKADISTSRMALTFQPLK